VATVIFPDCFITLTMNMPGKSASISTNSSMIILLN
jgi:hypothetical protein